MYKIIVAILIFPTFVFAPKKAESSSIKKIEFKLILIEDTLARKNRISIQKQVALDNCKLIEEQLNGVPEIKYEYDS